MSKELINIMLNYVDDWEAQNLRIALSDNDLISSPISDICVTTPENCFCGHLSSSLGHCSILCDDYLDKTPGLCYLKLFYLKNRALRKYGLSPEIGKILSKLSDEAEGKSIMLQADLLHAHVDGDVGVNITRELYFCYGCGFMKSKGVSSFGKVRTKACPRCDEHNATLQWVAEEFHHVRLGYMTGFNIERLIENNTVPVGYECAQPNIYYCEPVAEYSTSVKKHKGTYEIRIGPYIKAGSPESIKNFVHDFVANCWIGETDKSLELLGLPFPASKMTPDGINVGNRNVLELGTSYINSNSYLTSEFRGKVFKYEQELQDYNARLNVIIVSFNSVCTNIKLSDRQIRELCTRYLLSKPLEQQINEIEGRDIFSDSDTHELSRIKTMFKTYNPGIIESDTYKMNEIDLSGPISEAEKIEAKSIMDQEFENSSLEIPVSRQKLEEYLSNFNGENSRSDMKRVSNIPPVLIDANSNLDMMLDGDLPPVLSNLWYRSKEVRWQSIDNLDSKIENAKNNVVPDMKHLRKMRDSFLFKTTDQDKLGLHELSLGIKSISEIDAVKEKEAHSKLSFHPLSPTNDIDDFHRYPQWFNVEKNRLLTRSMRRAVIRSKTKSTGGLKQHSKQMWENIMDTKIMSYAMMITEIFTELSIVYKQWSKPDTFMKKITKSGVQMVIYNSKGHIFVSYAFPRTSEILSTGKIGPKLFASSTHIFSEFCSYNEPTLEHFVKAGPYLGGIIAHLMSLSKSFEFSDYLKEVCPKILLIYMNNKTDLEELITSQRYLFMKLFEDVGNDPYCFVDRLPSVIRSRLTSFYLQETIKIMDYYNEHSILKIPKKEKTMIVYDYLNIKSLFSDDMVTIDEKINEFYYGYVCSKERGRGSDRTFKVLSKILENEFEFRRTVKSIFTKGMKTPKFCTNRSLLKVFSHSFDAILKNKIGKEYKKIIFNDFSQSVAYSNFSILATLKASSRDHGEDLKMPEDMEGKTSKQVFEMLKKENPKEIKKRPKVMEALITIVDTYKRETGCSDINHESELLPWCLNDLIKNGHFDSDCFAKPQHGGDREIHVLSIRARLVQYHLEQISRSFCKFLPSETTINPDTKKRFCNRHYQSSKDMLGKNYFVMSKSADASKWCQGHHSSHFAALFSVISPPELTPFILSSLSLWPKKRLSFPLQMVSNLRANRTTVSSNSTFNQFRDEHFSGTGIFTQAGGNKIEIISGMFQGILHTTSSLYHTMIQEVMKQVCSSLLEKTSMNKHVITVIQGSDDSGMMVSFQGPMTTKKLHAGRQILKFKESVSKHLSVYTSVAKSSIGTVDLIEYNSEWFVRHKIIKPTFRWVSAAFSINVTERFIDRIRNFNNILKDCLEGGSSLLECAIIQLFQCLLHYILLGLQNQDTSDYVAELVVESCEPLLGFFPCDFDVSAGMVGVEFMLYSLFQFTNYGSSIKSRFDSDVELSYVPEDVPSVFKTKDLASIRLKFGHMSIYEKLLKNLTLGTYESAIEDIEKDPIKLWGRHTSWNEEKPSLILKVFNPGVKESLSNVSPSIRMIAASAYLHTFPCLSRVRRLDNNKSEVIKESLISSLINYLNENKSKPDVKDLFPLHDEFERIMKSILYCSNNMTLYKENLRKTSKVDLIIFEPPVDNLPILDICKRQWFNMGKLPLSRSQFKYHWQRLSLLYPFLDPTPGIEGMRNTQKNLKCSAVELKSFLESLNLRTRSITLQDTEVKSKELSQVMARAYWPGMMGRYRTLNQDQEANKIRSSLFSISTYWQAPGSLSELSKSVLCNSKYLQTPLSKLPNSLRRLKIMRDYLEGENRIMLMNQISQLKIGVLGFFSTRQSGVSVNRRGKGVWRGQICGVNTEMIFWANTCQSITFAKIQDSRSLGITTANLLREFKMVCHDESESDLYLSPSGRMTHDDTSKGNFRIYIDKELSGITMTDLETLEWDVEMSEKNNLRLVVYDSRHEGVEKLTILSENLSSRDWSPDCNLRSIDRVLELWAKGKMCVESMFEDGVLAKFPLTRSEYSKGNWKSSEFTHPWDLTKFRTQLVKYVNPSHGQSPIEDKKDEISTQEFEAFRSLTSGLNVSNFMTDFTTQLLSDAVEIPSDSDDDDFSFDVNKDHVDMLIKSFSLIQNEEEEILERVDNRSYMPSSHVFFRAIENMCQLQLGCSLRESVPKLSSQVNPKVKGTLGKILTIIMGTWVYQTDMEGSRAASKWEEESVGMSQSILEEQDLITLDMEILESSIEQISKSIEKTEGPAKTSLINSLNRFVRMKMLKSDSLSQDTGEDKTEYIINILMKCFEEGSFDKDDYPKKTTMWRLIFEDQLRQRVDQLYQNDQISNLESQRLRVSIQSNKLDHRYKAFCANYVLKH